MITTPRLDDFNRPSENPLSQGGNWSEVVSWAGSALQLVNPYEGLPAAKMQAGPNGASYRTDISFTGDGEVWGQVGRCDAANETLGLLLHVGDPATALDCYLATVGNRIGNNWLLYRISNGTPTLLLQTGGDLTPAAEVDYLLFRRVGNDLECWWYQQSSGFALQDPNGWTEMMNVTDTTFTSGSIGLEGQGDDSYWRGHGGGVPRQSRLQQVIRYERI